MNCFTINKRRFLTATSIGGLLVIIVWLAASTHQPEPNYQGKPLTYWLTAYATFFPSATATNTPSRFEAEEAVRAIGTNAVPVLLEMIQTKDSPVKMTLVQITQRLPLIKLRYTQASEFQAQAQAGFRVLGSSASNAVPELMGIWSRDSSALTRQVVVSVLGYIGPPAALACPMLLGAITNSDVYVRNNAAFALGKIHPQPELVIPALMKALNDSSPDVQTMAVVSLSEYGADARIAVPALLKWYKKATNGTASTAASGLEPRILLKIALQKIDPESLAQVLED